MEKTDQVHLKGPGTDLKFSIKGIPAVKCDGHRNIPDGEVYSAPVRDSMNGVIQYNADSMMAGSLFKNIRFEIKNGKIVDATCDGDVKKLNEQLDIDEGARYFGEFALGVNPHVIKPMLDTLFDEKIRGSFHLTPGNAYDTAPNGNKSALHWDIVCIQTPECGGGEIHFDGKLIRKDGLFVLRGAAGAEPREPDVAARTAALLMFARGGYESPALPRHEIPATWAEVGGVRAEPIIPSSSLPLPSQWRKNHGMEEVADR